MTKMLANSHGQDLFEHLIAVGLTGAEIVMQLGFKEERKSDIVDCVILAGLFHDLGKCTHGFQDFLKSKKKTKVKDVPFTDAEVLRFDDRFTGPFHNEISWTWLVNRLEIPINIHDKKRDALLYGVYWHHPANMNPSKPELAFPDAARILERIDNVDMVAIEKFTTELLVMAKGKSPELSRLIHGFKTKEGNVALRCPDFTSHKIDYIAEFAFKKVVLSCLIEADRLVSSLTKYDLSAIVDTNTYGHLVKKLKFTKPTLVSTKQTIRSVAQLKLASSCAESEIVVCGVDPGGGKTRIALKWWGKRLSNNSLLIALPRQVQVTGLFHTICKEAREVYESFDGLRIEGVFDGIRQHQQPAGGPQETEILNSDINILVFDRLLSPSYRRDQFSEFMLMLRSDLVLDEFHEFSLLHSMRPALKEILLIRSWMNNSVGTLLLSGTPDPGLCEYLGIQQKRLRNELPSIPTRKLKLSIEYSTGAMPSSKADTLFSFNRIRDSQLAYLSAPRGSKNIEIVHSDINQTEKVSRIESLINKFASNENVGAVYSSKMLQSSYDFNFNHGVFELSLPSIDCQSLGRVNRFGNKRDASIVFVLDTRPEALKLYRDDHYGFQKIHEKWVEWVKQVIGTGCELEFRNAMVSLFDNFWEDSDVRKIFIGYLKQYEQREIDERIQNWFPRRSKQRAMAKGKALNGLVSFRGQSRYLSAKIVDASGVTKGQLVEGNLLRISKPWEIKPLDDLASSIAKKLKCDKRFDVSKYKEPKGFTEKQPLFWSHEDPQIDRELVRQLKLKDATYKVYHEKIGLVDINLLKTQSLETDSDSSSGGLREVKTGKLATREPPNCEKPQKKLINRLNEKQELPSLSRRIPIYFIEHAKLHKGAEGIRVSSRSGSGAFEIPVASIGMLLLGPGTSISAEAFRIAAARRCMICVVGGQGVPLYSVSTQHRAPLMRIRQMNLLNRDAVRFDSARKLLARRWEFIKKYSIEKFPPPRSFDSAKSIGQLTAIEGAWTRAYYGAMARHYKVSWKGKRKASVDPKNPLIFLNFLSYSIADLVLYYLGLDPNLGILHGRTKGGGLCYDLADIIKPVVTMELSFRLKQNNADLISISNLKSAFMAEIHRTKAVDYIIESIEDIFGKTNVNDNRFIPQK